MKVRWVQCWFVSLPVLFVKSDSLVLSGFAALNIGFIVFVRSRAWDDSKLVAHELMHTKQLLRTAGLHGAMMLASKAYRLKSELEAYNAQLAATPRGERDALRERLAETLATRYSLDITQEQALALLGQGTDAVEGDGPAQEG